MYRRINGDLEAENPVQKDIPQEFCIVVPVFLRVKVRAEDDLQAECKAVELVRSMGEYLEGASSIKVLSIIAPAINTNPQIEHA